MQWIEHYFLTHHDGRPGAFAAVIGDVFGSERANRRKEFKDAIEEEAIPTMADGRVGTPIELRPLFERFCEEAIGPAVAAALTAAMKDAARNPNLFAPL